MRILENTHFDFVGKRRTAYMISGVMIFISLLSLAFRGLGYGIDFRGGRELIVETDQPVDVNRLRGALAGPLGAEPEVKRYGDDVLIRTSSTQETEAIQNVITTTLGETFPGSNARIVGVDTVGPRFADDLKRGALYSVFGSLLVIFVYILVRFEWRYGIASVVALAHDVIITLGIFSLLRGVVPFSLDIDQTIIAAFLTIVGYSINDTVVVFDRVREQANIFKSESYERLVNRAINQTLSRTFLTMGTTLLSILVLFIFGGEVLRGFAFALFLGIAVGTFSSIFVATPIVLELRSREVRAAR